MALSGGMGPLRTARRAAVARRPRGVTAADSGDGTKLPKNDAGSFTLPELVAKIWTQSGGFFGVAELCLQSGEESHAKALRREEIRREEKDDGH